ncbi:AAA family ATPase [Nocardioides sp. YIM B13467]|uniref:AAA family ATPase n=1 Tax=Nocardioides sp. YIM B13467 TaxID=3366294 RepID=UPI00366F112E
MEFPIGQEFLILYGPNGVGKTKTLEIISALLRCDAIKISSIPFSRARVLMSDGLSITAHRRRRRDNDVVDFTISRSGESLHEWEYMPEREQMQRRDSEAEFWNSPSPGIWVDERDGEILEEDEFIARYPFYRGAIVPEPFKEFVGQVEVTLIETQRLLSRRRDTRARRRLPEGLGDAAVSRYSHDLRNRLRSALASNSRATARLDRSFPRRILRTPSEVTISEDEIRARHVALNEKRARLANFSLIMPEAEVNLPRRELKDWETVVLGTYIEDTESKLQTFDDLLERLELLVDIINSRFLRKRIEVSLDEGLRIQTTGGERIRPEELSSGEQHELIMFYDLIFNVAAGGLVLIDEPEISLHVSWQRRFLDDILRVANITSARIIVATHSPMILGKWRSYTVEMGPSFGELEDGRGVRR